MAINYTGTSNSTQSLESRYNSKAQERELYLERARDCSELTIPTLIPQDGYTGAEDFETTYQGIGARGVNNLASKLLLSLLPPNAPFFRLAIDNFAVRELEEDENLRTSIDSGLVQIEKAVMDDIEMSNDRVVVFEALKHLIVAGNALLFVDKSGLRVFPLSQFVIERDPMGNVLEIITKESIHYNALPDYVREAVQSQQGDSKDDDVCDLYTCIKRQPDHFMVHQEVKGIKLEESFGKYKLDQSPYIPLRMVSAIDTWNKIKTEEVTLAELDDLYYYLGKQGVKRGFISKVGQDKELGHKVTLQEAMDNYGLKEEILDKTWKELFDKSIDVERKAFIEKAMNNKEDLHGEPRIVISTIHQAKGGEAENVAVYLDLSKAQKRSSTLQPDGLHRQFYVAVTRTIENLYFIKAQDDYYRYVI